MNKLKLLSLSIALITTITAYAGGLLTNTNQNIAFNRNFARDGVIAIDGVYSNPAGVAFLDKGLHLSFNVQNAYQTRVAESGVSVPSLAGTPFEQPFKLNGGDANGIKQYKGTASVPVLPSFQAALNYDKWGFQAGFALVGGGGKATFNKGLGSFERQVAMIPAMLYSNPQTTTTTPGYSVESYMNGQQYIFGLQLGATYKINDKMAVYGGLRFNYAFNKYEGSITNISANIAGNNENLYAFFGNKANEYNALAAALTAQAEATTDAAIKAQLQAGAAQAAEGAAQMEATQPQFADKYVDCTQSGWGITPIIGFDYKTGKWNFGTRIEFNTRLNIQNKTKRDDTGMFTDGVNTPSDLPGLWAVGAQYSILPSLRVMGSFHYFFDKSAKMADNKQERLSSNTYEILGGVEWDINKYITVSAGGQDTHYGLGDGGYLNDLSFVTSSYSLGFGAKIHVMKKVDVNIAYFWTNYQHFNKVYSETISLGGQSIEVNNTDDFYRTNRVFGVGIDISL